jgi:ABC-type amino acid transport substrate-binding protein
MKMPLLRQALGILFGSFLTVSAWGAPPPASPDMSAPPPAIEAPPGYKPPPSTLEKIRNFGAIYVGHRESSIPFSYMDDQGKIYGFSWELCERIVDAVKARLSMPALTVVPVLTNPGTRIMMVETGTLDLYCGSATNTEQRARYVSFSNTYFVTGIKGLVRKESGIKSAVDLRGKTIITTAGTTTDGYVKAATTRRNIFVNFRSARTHIDAFHQVLDGKADLFALDDILLQGLLATEDPTPHASGLSRKNPQRAGLRRRHRNAARSGPTFRRESATKILLKREDMQPVFSFKLRGAYNKIASSRRRSSSAA